MPSAAVQWPQAVLPDEHMHPRAQRRSLTWSEFMLMELMWYVCADANVR